ncbi:MAG: DUF3800 domain-containing protein [Patescibacteria group bacterium]|nr:DUF3800 domain-containing protein [Patescibacteria group bacterium]MCL5431991.1 DUF3800 domain-containing protein [Patescibacteria group bacterium]
MDCFGFIDESGNTKQERYFGIGLLLLRETGTLYDLISKRALNIHTISDLSRANRVDQLLTENKPEEVATIAKGGKRFELKFDRINFLNQGTYREIIKDYFTIHEAHFAAIIIDKQNPHYHPVSLIPGTWDTYMKYAGMLIAREAANLKCSGVCILADDLSKPGNIQTTFEQNLETKTKEALVKRGMSSLNFKCTRLESHASLLIQLVDVLLGCVTWDYKQAGGLVSNKLAEKRSGVVNELKMALNKKSICGSFTATSPSYFSVWEMDWRN